MTGRKTSRFQELSSQPRNIEFQVQLETSFKTKMENMEDTNHFPLASIRTSTCTYICVYTYTHTYMNTHTKKEESLDLINNSSVHGFAPLIRVVASPCCRAGLLWDL